MGISSGIVGEGTSGGTTTGCASGVEGLLRGVSSGVLGTSGAFGEGETLG